MKSSNLSVKKLIQKHGFTFCMISMMFFSLFTFYKGLTAKNHLFHISTLILIIVFVFILRLIQFKKYIIKYGIILGVATIIHVLSFNFLKELENKLTITHLFVLTIGFLILLFITIVSILLGLKAFKKNNDGYISLKEALKISIGIALIGGLIAMLCDILRIHVIDSGFIDQMNENNFKKLVENSTEITQKDIDRRMAITKRVNSPLIMISRSMAAHLCSGILFGLIFGLIIRKKKKESLT
ncbi:DUF4199 domain-containing protein [Aquimarina litoralis]|uniref:DUF4199 domain-containing protein n=1 Tax=Aquimarina litoralis TaxID=584605 RepID=UPI001C592FB8|nr:DUF4199 domain-containing protein [Aquimarina litoralis]MBW1295739.1 DUF4199 family protein [Aquimarina litoralis]